MTPARHLTLRDEPASAAALRAAVDELAPPAFPSDARFALKVAATEALANALKRTGEEEQAVEVAVLDTGKGMEVEVLDSGTFRLDFGAGEERGRGLPLMVALADEVEFASTDAGTRVRIRKHLAGAAEAA